MLLKIIGRKEGGGTIQSQRDHLQLKQTSIGWKGKAFWLV